MFTALLYINYFNTDTIFTLNLIIKKNYFDLKNFKYFRGELNFK